MDLLTKIKEKIGILYSNKYFKFIFFTCFLVIVAYKYSNIKDTIKEPERLDGINIPKKINMVKKAQDDVYTKMALKREENIQKSIEDKKQKEAEERRKEQELKKQERIDKIKKEFTANKTNKKGKRIEAGEIVNVKMIMTNGDNYDIIVNPILMPIKATRDEGNIFGKKIIGKRVGDVVIIPLKDFLKEKSFQKAFNKIKEEQKVNDANLNMDIVANSPMVYRIKILGIKNK